MVLASVEELDGVPDEVAQDARQRDRGAGHAGGRIDYGGRMNLRFECSSWMKENQCASKSEVRIVRAQDSQIGARHFDIFADVDC